MAFCYAYRTGIMREIRTAGADPELKTWTMDDKGREGVVEVRPAVGA